MGRQLGEKNPAHREWAVWTWCLVCAGWLVLVWTWDAFHLAMSVDDTYYYFKTALHVSRGLGSTFDGLNPTDGYHPLWLAILALAFKPFANDMVHLTRVAFTLQVGMVWIGGLLLSCLRAAGGTKLLWPLALVLANPFSAKIVLCGQETALQFLLSSAALLVWWSLREAPRGYRLREWAGLAMICALAALARLDTVFFCGALLAMPLALPSALERKAGTPARLQITGLGFALFGCGLGSFLLYHLAVFHHLMPVSGAIKQHMDADEIASHAARIAATVVATAGILGFWLVARRRRSPVLALLAPAVVGTLCVAIYNFGLRGELSPSLIRIWYLEPFLLTGVLVVGAVLAGRWRARLVVIVLGGAAVVWLGLSGLSWRYRLESRSYRVYQAAERCSRWANEHTAPGAIGAAWDAGFAGAFTDRPVINLDGLVNSWDYKETYFDQGRVDELVFRRQPVDFVIQYAWPGTLRAVAARFAGGGVPTVSEPQTTVTGSHDRRNLSGRWGIDLAPFFVAHVECMTVSMAYDPAATVAPVFYFVLTRSPEHSRTTLAEFAQANAGRASCDGFTSP
ncbi:MAG: hypothetical protein ABIY55_32625 [Kofleriaceae bacterium]